MTGLVLGTRLTRQDQEIDVRVEFEVIGHDYIFSSAWFEYDDEPPVTAEEVVQLQGWLDEHQDDAYETVRGTDYDPAMMKTNSCADRHDTLRGER